MFNTDNVPTLGHRGVKAYKNTTSEWYKKAVRDILMDTRVYGYCEFLDTDGYFPAIIAKEKFHAVQNRLALRAVAEPTGGPVEGAGNLFTGICRCAHCGAVMSKTSTRKRYKGNVKLYEYLVCDGARTGMGCSYLSIPYATFEKTFLASIHTDTFCETMTDNEANKVMEDRLAALEGEKVVNGKQIQKLTGLILNDEKPSVTLMEKLKEFEAREIKLSKEIQLATAQSQAARAVPTNLIEMIEQTDKLIPTKEGRMKVREYIRNTIDRIDLDTSVNPMNYQIRFKDGHVGSVVIWTEREQNEITIQIFQVWPGIVRTINWQHPISYLPEGLTEKHTQRIIALYNKRRFNK
jgi:hypothetical protein